MRSAPTKPEIRAPRRACERSSAVFRSPEIKEIQAVRSGSAGIGTTAPGGTLDVNGGTVTTSVPALKIEQTWNNVSTYFDAPIFENITNTASNALSLLMDLQVGGTSKFTVDEAGNVVASTFFVRPSGTNYFAANNGNFVSIDNQVPFGFANGDANNGPDTILTRAAAANLHLGSFDTTSPVAQTLGVQGVVAGTSNTVGANFTIDGSQGTGNAAGGSILFQTAPAGGSGTSQNALATAMAITSTGSVGIVSAKPASLSAQATAALHDDDRKTVTRIL